MEKTSVKDQRINKYFSFLGSVLILDETGVVPKRLSGAAQRSGDTS